MVASFFSSYSYFLATNGTFAFEEGQLVKGINSTWTIATEY